MTVFPLIPDTSHGAPNIMMKDPSGVSSCPEFMRDLPAAAADSLDAGPEDCHQDGWTVQRERQFSALTPFLPILIFVFFQLRS